MKKYILLAGVNGAGKSTLYKLQPGWSELPKVNTDDIARELGRWDDFGIVLQAGKTAVFLYLIEITVLWSYKWGSTVILVLYISKIHAQAVILTSYLYLLLLAENTDSKSISNP